MPKSVRYLLFLSLGLYVLCLALVSLRFEIGPEDLRGWFLLLQGWRVTIADGFLAWLANPLLLATFVLLALRRYRLALGCAVAAFGLALTYMAVLEMRNTAHAGSTDTGSLALGYRLWLASMLASAAAAVMGLRTRLA